MLPRGQALVEEGNKTKLLGRQEDKIQGQYKERVILLDSKVTANIILVLVKTVEYIGYFNQIDKDLLQTSIEIPG